MQVDDWINFLIHLSFAIVYGILVYRSIQDDPYKSEDVRVKMYPTFHAAASWVGLTSLLVGVAYLSLGAAAVQSELFNGSQLFIYRDKLIYPYILFASGIMLVLAAVGLWRSWLHSIGLFILATAASVLYSVFTIIAFQELNDFFHHQLISIVGSSVVLLAAGFLFTAQYFYSQRSIL